MPYYKCIFMNDEGKYLKRVLFSESKRDLKENYIQTEEKLISVRRLFGTHFSLTRLFFRKIGYHEFLVFNQKMITMLKAGLPFVRALEIVTRNTRSGNLKEVLLKAETDIKNGLQISDAFNSQLIPFQRIYRASLMAGEKSGGLETILEKFNIYLDKISRLKKKTISSLTYPIILFTFMIGMVLLILLYAVPTFASFYEDLEANLPLATILLISFANWMKNNFLWIIFGFGFLYFFIRFLERINKKRVIIDLIKIRMPFLGKVIAERAMALFARTLSILIYGGIPIPEAATIAIETFSNQFFINKVENIPVKIKEGKLLSDVLSETGIFPEIMVEVVKVGESSGNLIDVLDKNAEYFENSIDMKINTLISLIEPIIIIFLGLVIAFMLFSVYLPIFNTVRIVG